MAEAILSGLLDRRGVAAEIASAGLLAGGQPMARDALAAVANLGYAETDLSLHRSRKLSASDVRHADLVLSMAREHLREVVVLVPGAWDRTFTLKELVRQGEVVGRRVKDQDIGVWLATVAAGRSRESQLGSSTADDVADPIGGTPAMFEKTAGEIEVLCQRLVALLWGSALAVTT
jgi:protein-tyrosine phosphatase